MSPVVSDLNLTPTSIEAGSPESAVAGVTLVPQIEHGQLHVDRDPRPGVSRLPLSSTARVLIVVVGLPVGDPGVAPGDRGVRRGHGGHRVPGAAAVGGDLDAGDHAAACVGRGPADGHRRTVGEGRPGVGDVIVEVGGVVSVDAWRARAPPSAWQACAPISARTG